MSHRINFGHFIFLEICKTPNISVQDAARYREKVIDYYKKKYDDAIKTKARKSTWRSTVQVTLSQLKKKLRESGYPKEIVDSFSLSKEDSKILKQERARAVFDGSIALPEIYAEPLVIETRKIVADYLSDEKKPYLCIIALAALTGRRTVELLLTGNFDDPQESHFTNEDYWCSFSGAAKQRTPISGELMRRDIPLLEKREVLVKAIVSVRKNLKIDPKTMTNEMINRKFAKQISRTMQRGSVIEKIHDFRKFWACTCFHYFNERACSLPRFASAGLMHKEMSSSVITYLASRVICKGTLHFGNGILRRE